MATLEYIFKQILHSWRHHFILQLGSLVVISSSLTVVFSIFLFFSNTERTLVTWGSSFDINIFLKDGLKSDEIAKVKSTIEELGYFKKIDFVTQQDASEKFFSKMSKYIPDFTNQKDFANLIPASFVGSLAQKVNLSEMQQIATSLQSIAGVQDISYGQEWLDGLSSFLRLLKRIGWGLSSVLIVGSFFVVAFSVYAVLSRRREEVEVFELCGATARMIQAPFVFESILLSLVASVIAISVSYFFLNLENEFFVSKMSYLGFNEPFIFATATEIIVFMFLSAAISGTVSAYCAKQINTGWAQAERENRS